MSPQLRESPETANFQLRRNSALLRVQRTSDTQRKKQNQGDLLNGGERAGAEASKHVLSLTPTIISQHPSKTQRISSLPASRLMGRGGVTSQ